MAPAVIPRPTYLAAVAAVLRAFADRMSGSNQQPAPDDFPHCHWQITDQRTGICLSAGFFQMGDAVREGLKWITAGGWVGTIVVEPWFDSRANEFRFWAEWWAMQERATR
jgi:hypothetical protein